MNERIQSLLDQCLGPETSEPDTSRKEKNLDLEKFAELIVKECCEVAHCNFHVDGLTLSVMLKEHFGVER